MTPPLEEAVIALSKGGACKGQASVVLGGQGESGERAIRQNASGREGRKSHRIRHPMALRRAAPSRVSPDGGFKSGRDIIAAYPLAEVGLSSGDSAHSGSSCPSNGNGDPDETA